MSDKIYIFDTTLRDGEQSAGVAFTPTEKLEIAKQLEILNVDVIDEDSTIFKVAKTILTSYISEINNVKTSMGIK